MNTKPVPMEVARSLQSGCTVLLDMTTGHMQAEDADLLTSLVEEGKAAMGEDYPVTYVYDRGFFIWLGKDHLRKEREARIKQWETTGFSLNFLHVLRLLLESEIEWVRFDADSPANAMFPTFDW